MKINVTTRERWAAFCALYSVPWTGTVDELAHRLAASDALELDEWEELLSVDAQGNQGVRATPKNLDDSSASRREVELTPEAAEELLGRMLRHPTASMYGRAKTRLALKLRTLVALERDRENRVQELPPVTNGAATTTAEELTT